MKNVLKFADYDLPDDPTIQSNWACYVAILSCGYLESSVRQIFTQYSRNRSDDSVQRFVEYQLKAFQNPNTQKIYELVQKFDKDRASQIDQFWQDEIKDSIDSLVNIRHSIVHGRDSGVSFGSVKKYFYDLDRFLQFLEQNMVR